MNVSWSEGIDRCGHAGHIFVQGSDLWQRISGYLSTETGISVAVYV